MKNILALFALTLALSRAHLAAPGELDPTFNGVGTLPVTGSLGGYLPVNLLLVQPDGKILFARSVTNGIDLVRLNPSGSPDLTFGSNGVSYIHRSVSWWVDLRQILPQPDGKM